MTTSSRANILAHLVRVRGWRSSAEIAEELGAHRSHIAAQLSHMCAAQVVTGMRRKRCFLYRAAGAKP